MPDRRREAFLPVVGAQVARGLVDHDRRRDRALVVLGVVLSRDRFDRMAPGGELHLRHVGHNDLCVCAAGRRIGGGRSDGEGGGEGGDEHPRHAVTTGFTSTGSRGVRRTRAATDPFRESSGASRRRRNSTLTTRRCLQSVAADRQGRDDSRRRIRRRRPLCAGWRLCLRPRRGR